MKQKPHLSFWQVWNMSFGFLGIQFGFALQNANVSRIFETLGANINDIPILWIAAPVTGLIIQPIIGHWSDKTWCKLGRRRPFFLVGAILASVALFIMPNSPVLWVAAGMLWIMDASINVSMEPFRAFVGDMLPAEQRTTGFAMQSFFIGIGAVVASLLPYLMTNWFGFSNTAPEGMIPDSVKYSFYIGGFAFITAVVWTVFKSKEYSPEQLKEFNNKQDENIEVNDTASANLEKRALKVGVISMLLGIVLVVFFFFSNVQEEVYILAFGLILFGLLEFINAYLQNKKVSSGFTSVINDLNTMPLTMRQLSLVQFFSWFALFALWIYTTNGVTADKYDMKIDKTMVSFLASRNDSLVSNHKITSDKYLKIKKEISNYNYELNDNDEVSADVNFVKFFLNNRIFKEKLLIQKLSKIINGVNMQNNDVIHIKKQLTELHKVKVPDISDETIQRIIKLSSSNYISLPKEMNKSFKYYARLKHIRAQYNQGANWVGVGFGVYNGFAAILAFFIMFFARITNRKITHAMSLFVGGLSFLAVFFIQDTSYLLLIPFIGIGLAWASILSVPYAILTGSLPQNKMGVYMGIFNFFIVIPQILAASILGYLIKTFFNNHAIYALVLGSVSLIIAAILVLFVDDNN